MAQFEGGTQGMLLERTEYFDEYGHSLGGRDVEYAYKKPSVLWTDVRGIKDFLPTSANKSVRSAEFFNRSVRFITVLAIVLAIAFRSWWPLLFGGGLFLLIILLSAGLQAATRRAAAQGAIVGAAVATAVSDETGSDNQTANPPAANASNANKSNVTNTNSNSNNRSSMLARDSANSSVNSRTSAATSARPNPTLPSSETNLQNKQNESMPPIAIQSNTNRTENGNTSSQPIDFGESPIDRYMAEQQQTVKQQQQQQKQQPFINSEMQIRSEGDRDSASSNITTNFDVNQIDLTTPYGDAQTYSAELESLNVRPTPKEPYPEPLSPFAQAMMERYKEISAQENQRRAPLLSRLQQLEQDSPYNPTDTIPNPSSHNNWLQVDSRYRAEDPLPYKHTRAQAVGYADDVPSEELRGSLMNKIMCETNGKGPNGSGNPTTTLIGINPESASLSQVSSLYRRSSLHDNVDSIYAGANACRPNHKSAGTSDRVMHDPTERMINDMYEDSTDRIWKQQFLDRRPPPWINPNDSQSRRAEEQSAIDRQSWRGFSMHQGP